MEDGAKKPSTLSIDRAAFLILRVKKAFKKKRQQRKEKQAQQNAETIISGFSGSKVPKTRPPPLLRSRTLPSIIVPGITILHAQVDPSADDESTTITGTTTTSYTINPTRLNLQQLTPKISLTSDDSPLDYRRKSAGNAAPNHQSNFNYSNNSSNNSYNNEPYIYAFDEVERHPDGTVILRIPSPHVVAARAYHMANSNASSSKNTEPPPSQQSLSTTSNNAIYRLARLLNQTTKSNVPLTPEKDAPRRLSWERRDPATGHLPRSSSIDSMVEAVWCDSPRSSISSECPGSVPVVSSYGNLLAPNRRESFMSPSPGRKAKLNRGINEITLPENISNSLAPSPTLSSRSEPSQSPLSRYFKFHRNSTTMEFVVPQAPPPISKVVQLQRKPQAQSESHQQNNNYVFNDVLITSNNFQNQQNHQSSVNNKLGKMTKKQNKVAQAQQDKIEQINIHLHALFSAVEHGHLEKARTILESTDVDVNSVNSDGLAPLDVAVLSNNRSMTKMLLQHGAAEGIKFNLTDTLGCHINTLLLDAEKRVHELGGADDPHPQGIYNTRASFSSIISSGQSVTGCTGTEIEKQLGLWERRVKGLRRMLLGWDQARPPDPPSAVSVDVIGLNSVQVRAQEPIIGPICTKFKVQWSSRADFGNIMGERDVHDWISFQGVMGADCRLGELTQGRRYFFRACCGNIKGFGAYKISNPTSVIPSSWRDVDKKEPRFTGRLRVLDDLFTAVKLARPGDASDIPLEINALQRRNPKKKTTIKQLFSAASKFQKNLKRGIYLACILYHDDKVLVTNEDFIPVIEIDETYPSSLHGDYYWLMKVACTWDDVKSLRVDMERNATSAVHFRTKLLTAANQMQSALCFTDLGQLYHKPLKDSHGTVVLCCVNSVKSPKSVSVLNSRWIPLNKVYKKITIFHEENNINEILMNSIIEQINYHQASTVRLSRGLYLGYLKMQSSVDQIQIVVPTKTPNVLPHFKIRDNPHISAEEWELIKRNKHFLTLDFRPKSHGPTEVQLCFLESLTLAAHRLFNSMDITLDDAFIHRLYDIEVIELSSEVSFLIICPPAESSCAVPGQREILLQRGDLLSMPIQAFEMIHLRTYQNSIIQKYSRLSCILELDTVVAKHSHREAFSTSEVQAAKERLVKLQELTAALNAIWKGVRWLMDVITFARDKANMPGFSMKEILHFQDKENKFENEKVETRQLLQLPQSHGSSNKIIKTSPGRGSWPGPANQNTLGPNGLLSAEHSKSEQQLVMDMHSKFSSRYLSATSGLENINSRKNSADSNFSQSANSYYSACDPNDVINSRLPPSRSEDTLVTDRKKLPSNSHRKRSTTVNTVSLSAATSPLLNNRSMVSAINVNSAHSLSSDSETASCPLPAANERIKIKTTFHFGGSNKSIPTTDTSDSDSSRKCKKQLFEPGSYLKSTLNALQNDTRIFKESLHIAEEDNEDILQPFRKAPDNTGSGIRSSESESFITPKNYAERNPQSIDRRTNPFAQATSSPEKSTKKQQLAESDQSVAKMSSNNSSTSSVTSSSSTTTNGASILQVYAAYTTGLASGTSLKLRVTPRTTAREVIDLVVKQLNMAVVLKGKDGPIYTPDKLENFCLVAVIGARERCLRDDFQPLQLQNPWKKGRLFVRLKHDLLAAIEHCNREVADL